MVATSKEIEELRERLAKLEKGISELKKQDLDIAQVLATRICSMAYRVSWLFLKAEKREQYVELWTERLENMVEQLKGSQTVAENLEITGKFFDDLTEYLGATKVATAQEAMEIAHSFIKKYVPVALPMKALREDDVWNVDVDVGALVVKVAKIKVDARTGDILSYDIPAK